MEIVSQDGLLRALCLLSLMTMQKAGDEKAVLDAVDRATRGIGAVSNLFELASESGVGEPAEPSEVDGLLASEDSGVRFILIDLGMARCESVSAGELLEKGLSNFVGVGILRARDPEWMFWCPVGYPLSDRRMVFVPRWRGDF